MKCNSRFNLLDLDPDEIEAHRSRCDGIIKTDGVMFGEPIPPDVLQNAFREAERCDCLIVAGTSSVVYPAARLIPTAKRNNARMIEVNAEESGMTRSVSDHFLKGKTGEILPSLVDEIKRLKEVEG
jgi:NAD-dependent deacetylase